MLQELLRAPSPAAGAGKENDCLPLFRDLRGQCGLAESSLPCYLHIATRLRRDERVDAGEHAGPANEMPGWRIEVEVAHGLIEPPVGEYDRALVALNPR